MSASRATGGRLARTGKRWLYLVHRWLGVAACLFFLFWFVSGVVMMYVPYPRLEPAERLAGLAPIDWSRVRVQPTEAMARAGLDEFPAGLRLEMQGGRPVWRIRDGFGRRHALSAVDGRPIGPVDAEAARALAGAFAGRPVARVEKIHDDQWTVAQGFKWARPLYRVSLGDDAGTQLYVASTTGEIVQNSDRRERFWNWLGAVPHWLYFTVVRQDGAFWRQLVMWTSGPAAVVGITGLWVGILRMRLKPRYRSGSFSPYRSGWMKWHHVVGLFGGLTAITWMASGWLSVNPFQWFARGAPAGAERRYAAHDAPDFAPLDGAGLARALPGARGASLGFVAGRPLVTLDRDAATHRTVSPAGVPTRFTRAELRAAAARIVPGAPIASATLLTEPDVYWYSHWHDRPLPVLRVVFADADRTWVHLDPATGSFFGAQTASGRLYRWLFNFLHDFDLPFLVAWRVVRDPLMWLLSALGIVTSLTGIVIGWRRIRHKLQPHAHMPAR